jgi:pilus assembly protein CpaE
VARIYVIDDDEQLLRMVGLMLERGGHSAVLISDPFKGLERVKADRPDLLVLDVMMPNLSGHEVTRQIRATKGLEGLPILMLTARSQEVDRITAIKSGASDYLSKPVTSQELIQQVDGLLARRIEGVVSEKGLVIAFYGLRGGVGQTTLAVNLAAALRRVSQQSVCLIEFSPSIGQAVWHMRLQARSTWADLPVDGLLDWNILKNRLMSHPSGLHVLAAPMTPESPTKLSAGTTQEVLELLRENMDFTIVDLPRSFSPSFVAGLQAADIALHVVAPEMIAVQTAVSVNRALKREGLTFRQQSYILNQVVPEAQLARTTVERGLNERIAFQVGYDSNQNRAQSQGVPLVLTSAQSPLPTVIRRMADVIWQRVTAKSQN